MCVKCCNGVNSSRYSQARSTLCAFFLFYFSGGLSDTGRPRLGEVPWIFGEHSEVDVLLLGEPNPESTEYGFVLTWFLPDGRRADRTLV